MEHNMKHHHHPLLTVAICLIAVIVPMAHSDDAVIEIGATDEASTSIAIVAQSGATAPVPAVTSGKPAENQPPQEMEVFDFNDIEIQTVLRSLAAQAGLNLILGNEVTGKVTVHLESVAHEDAIQLIAESKGFAFVKTKNVIQIKSRDAVQAEPLELQMFPLNYAKAEDVKKTIDPVISNRGKVQVDSRGNMLIVSETRANLDKITPLIASLDTQTPQVLIEAKFVETSKNPKKDLGINWSDTLLNHELKAGNFDLTKNLGGGPWIPSTALLDAGSAKVVFSFLARDEDTELLANPRVVTTDNQKAKISIATQFPIPSFSFSEQTASLQISGFDYKDIGIILNVHPRINKDDFITLEVAPEASSFNESATLQSGGGSSVQIPIINTRTANTTVLIKSGNTLAIGGLMRQDVSDRYTKVPIMGDLPVLGPFFRSKSLDKSKRDLLIFLTPTIVKPDQQTGYEKFVDGFPKEEVYTTDKWMPRDNAKPRDIKVVMPPRTVDVASEPPQQNFAPKRQGSDE